MDVKSAFPSVHKDASISELKQRGRPSQYATWFSNKPEQRFTSLCFDDFESELLPILHGIDQGCPSSPPVYIIYDVGLHDLPAKPKCIKASLFIDDASFLARGANFSEACAKLKSLIENEGGILDWARRHNVVFEFGKCAIVGFTHNKGKLPCPSLQAGGYTIESVPAYKYLGVTLDNEPRFKHQLSRSLEKGTIWANTIRRICNTRTGLPPPLVPKLYKSVAIPRILYGAEVFLTPCLARISPKHLQTHIKAGPLARLAHAQRQASIATTGALKSTPSVLLDAPCNLSPFPIAIQHWLSRATLRLASAPPNHPLFTQIERAKLGKQRKHPSPIVLLFSLFPVKLDSIESIPTIRHPPWWKAKARTEISDRETAIAIPKPEPYELQIHTDGSVIDGGVGAATMAHRENVLWKTNSHHLGSAKSHTIFEAEILAISLAVRLAITRPGIRILSIYCDSQAVIQATQLNHRSSGCYLVDKLHDDTKKLKNKVRNLKMFIRWTPGHDGHVRQDKVDEMAKKAAKNKETKAEGGDQDLKKDLPESVAALRMREGKRLKKARAVILCNAPQWSKYKHVDPQGPNKRFKHYMSILNRPQISILTQLRTGHTALNAHLHRINKMPSPICPACNEGKETPLHFLVTCPCHENARDRWLYIPEHNRRSLQALLDHPIVIPYTLRYIAATNRFGKLFK